VAWMFGVWLLALVVFRVLGRDDVRRAGLLFRSESSDG
jgi:hypothetical protein